MELAQYCRSYGKSIAFLDTFSRVRIERRIAYDGDTFALALLSPPRNVYILLHCLSRPTVSGTPTERLGRRFLAALPVAARHRLGLESATDPAYESDDEEFQGFGVVSIEAVKIATQPTPSNTEENTFPGFDLFPAFDPLPDSASPSGFSTPVPPTSPIGFSMPAVVSPENRALPRAPTSNASGAVLESSITQAANAQLPARQTQGTAEHVAPYDDAQMSRDPVRVDSWSLCSSNASTESENPGEDGTLALLSAVAEQLETELLVYGDNSDDEGAAPLSVRQ